MAKAPQKTYTSARPQSRPPQQERSSYRYAGLPLPARAPPFPSRNSPPPSIIHHPLTHLAIGPDQSLRFEPPRHPATPGELPAAPGRVRHHGRRVLGRGRRDRIGRRDVEGGGGGDGARRRCRSRTVPRGADGRLIRFQGAYAEFINVTATHLFPKPEGLSWVQAAAIPEVWLTGG